MYIQLRGRFLIESFIYSSHRKRGMSVCEVSLVNSFLNNWKGRRKRENARNSGFFLFSIELNIHNSRIVKRDNKRRRLSTIFKQYVRIEYPYDLHVINIAILITPILQFVFLFIRNNAAIFTLSFRILVFHDKRHLAFSTRSPGTNVAVR